MAENILANSGIYCLFNIHSEKIYIGSAVNIESRVKQHIDHLVANKHHSAKLQNSWNKHGKDGFYFSVIEFVDKESLTKTEQKWMDFYNAAGDSGYNICAYAQSVLGIKRSPEVRAKLKEAAKNQSAEKKAKISATLTGRKRPPEVIAKLALYRPTAEAIEKIAAQNRGKKHSEEHKRKISESGKKAWLTRKNRNMSESTKAALIAANTGRVFTEEHKKKMSQAKIGKKHSEETLQKLRGRKISEESRQKMRVAAALREQKKKESREPI